MSIARPGSIPLQPPPGAPPRRTPRMGGKKDVDLGRTGRSCAAGGRRIVRSRTQSGTPRESRKQPTNARFIPCCLRYPVPTSYGQRQHLTSKSAQWSCLRRSSRAGHWVDFLGPPEHSWKNETGGQLPARTNWLPSLRVGDVFGRVGRSPARGAGCRPGESPTGAAGRRRTSRR